MIWPAAALAVLLALGAPFLTDRLRRPVRRRRLPAGGQVADLPQGRTWYRWSGPAGGPVVVCVHGLTTPSCVWDDIARVLAGQGARVLVYDLYGRGCSDRPPGAQDSGFFVRQLADLLDHEGIAGPVTLLGYSMGGAIVPAFAAAHPERAARMGLIAPAGMGHDLGRLCAVAARLPLAGDWLMRAVWPLHHLRGIREDAEAPRDLRRAQRAELRWRGFPGAVLASLRGILAEDMEPAHLAVARSDIQSLVIWARQDAVIPIQGRATLSRWNLAAQQHVVENAGHGLTYGHGDAVAAILADWLAAAGVLPPEAVRPPDPADAPAPADGQSR